MLVFCHVSLQGHCSGPLAKKDGSCVGGLVWPHVSIGDWGQCSWVQILILNKTVISFDPWQRPPVPRRFVLCTDWPSVSGLAV